MIPPGTVLAGIRRDLREIVLPAVDDDYARAAVIAMVGILGELSTQVRLDEAWCATSAQELADGCGRWAAALGEDHPAAGHVLELRSRAATFQSPQARRELLLTAACEVLATGAEPASRDVRRVLASDLSRQLAPTIDNRT